jgi:hypothetical protein
MSFVTVSANCPWAAEATTLASAPFHFFRRPDRSKRLEAFPSAR